MNFDNWLNYQEGVRCAFGDHSNHVHPQPVVAEQEEIEDNDTEDTPEGETPEETESSELNAEVPAV